MPQAQVVMTVREGREGSKVIDIDDEVTGFCEGILMEAHAQADHPETSLIALNFDGLRYMNSGGIGMLLTMLIRAQRNNHRLAAFGLSEHYRQIFSLTRLDEVIALYDSEADAIAGS